ncbi:MAG: hypothetical protein QG646_921 [Euryarchaeota archaeon]|nr:hypothetical protein [Euryarchaeota archaeon]
MHSLFFKKERNKILVTLNKSSIHTNLTEGEFGKIPAKN